MKQKIIRMADLMCGAGGTSTGAKRAMDELGWALQLLVVNHWPTAVATHRLNHPYAKHICTSVDDVNPRAHYKRGELDVLWASPECTHHSIARGGVPVNEQSRATAFCVLRWAETLSPPVILVENVKEFRTWGPIGSDGRPIQRKKGQIFHAWLESLRAMGYTVDYRILCSVDYGDPTTRERLIVQAVRGRRKIVWPDPTHGAGRGLLAAPTAREDVIDWKLQGRWIDEMPPKAQYDGLPMSPNTLKRINKGFFKIGLKNFIVGMEHTGANGAEARALDQAVSTISCKAHKVLIEPFLVTLRGTKKGQLASSAYSIDGVVKTISSGGGHTGLAEPFLFQLAHPDGDRVFSIRANVPTISGNRGDLALIEPAMLPQQSCGRLRSVSEAVPTITTDGGIGLVEPYLVKYYGTAGAQSIDDALDAVTTKDRHALVSPVIEINGERCRVRYKYRMLQPHELSAAQGFPKDYEFVGNKTEQVKQIGNAVTCGLAAAILKAVLTQKSAP